MLANRNRKTAIILAAAAMLVASLACGPAATVDETAADAAPVVVITSPDDGAAFAVGDVVEIAFAAQYEPGVERVELLVNGSKAAELSATDDSESGLMGSLQWTAEAEGNISLSVIAYGVGNAISSPAFRNIVVTPTDAADVADASVAGESPEPPAASTTEASTGPAPATTEPPCTMNAAFVTDVTIPDGSEIAAGTDFTKTWRIRNSGTCDWDGVQLVFSSGSQMNGPAVTSVMDASPGAEVDVTVNLKAPADPDDYTGYWKLRSDGSYFGTNLIVVINVPEEEGEGPVFEGPFLEIEPIPGFILTLPTVDTVINQESIPAGSTASSTVECPAETIVTGGGYAAQDGLFIYNSSKSGNGWRVYAKNNTGSAKPLNAYAVCMANTEGSSSQILNQVSVSGGSIGHAVASCPAGSVLTGGGWAGRHDGSLFVYNSSRSGNGWQVYAKNTTGSSIPLNAYAICVSGISASSNAQLVQVTVNNGTYNSASPECDSGLRTGGGFAVPSNPNMFVYNTSPDGSAETIWRTYASNNTGSNQLMNSYAICTVFE